MVRGLSDLSILTLQSAFDDPVELQHFSLEVDNPHSLCVS